MSQTPQKPLFPIRIISERTGVGTSTLRAWERRYGLLKPQRTPKGHRLYSEEDVQLIHRILDLLNQGHSIGNAARFVKEGGERYVTTSNTNSAPGERERGGADLAIGQHTHWDDYLTRSLQAVTDFSSERLDAVYNEASANYPVELVSEMLILPALERLGTRWRVDRVSIGEEHFFSAWLRNKLGARLHHSAGLTTGSTLIIACVPGHQHEMGALLFSLAAMGRGYRTIYLGADMPLEPISDIVHRTNALGVVLATGDKHEYQKMLELIQALHVKIRCPLFVGGRYAVDHHVALTKLGIHPIGEQFSLAVQLVAAHVPVHATQTHTDEDVKT